MKNKGSFSPRSIRQAVVDHFEKVVLGAVVLVFLWILYGAWGREQLTWGPSDLSAAVSQAQDKVKRAQDIFPKEKMPQVKPYGRIAQGIRTPIDGGKYLPSGPPMFVSGSPFPGTMSPRLNPLLYPLRDLRVAAGCGAFAMGEFGEEGAGATVGGPAMPVAVGGSGAQLRGQRWAVVTGVIDFKKQRDAYNTAFQQATFHSPMDFPVYSYYYVERAEVNPQNPVDPQYPAAQLTWVPMKTRAAFSSALSWQGTSQEVVDPQFLPPLDPDGVPLAFPLGPLQNRTWGAEVAHPREIPVLELSTEGAGAPYGVMGGGPYGVPPKRSAAKPSEEAKDAEGQPAGKEQEDAKKKADAERRKRARALLGPDLPDAPMAGGGPIEALTPGMGAGPSAMGMSPYGASPYGASGMRPGMGSGGYSGDVARRFSGSPAGAYAPGMAAEGEAVELPAVLLFRFFDFTVEPGKHYCYRVKLLLRNPNATVSPQYLERDDLGRRPHLETVMSAPSPVISVSRDSQALIVEAQPSATDPKAGLMLVHFNYDDGELANEKFQSLPRGQLLNFRGRPFTPGQGGAMGPYGAVLPDPQGEAPKVDYLTEALLLDVAGGAKLPPQRAALTECASVLLLDPDGKLVVREEIDDLSEVRQRDKPAGPVAGQRVGPEGPGLYGSGPYDPYEKAKKPKKKGKVQPGPASGLPPGYPTGGGGPPPGYPAGGAAGYSGGGPGAGYPGSGGMPGAKGGRKPPPNPYGPKGGGADRSP